MTDHKLRRSPHGVKIVNAKKNLREISHMKMHLPAWKASVRCGLRNKSGKISIFQQQIRAQFASKQIEGRIELFLDPGGFDPPKQLLSIGL